MERLVWMGKLSPVPAEATDISGTYSALVNGTECVVELELGESGGLNGRFYAEGEQLQVAGGVLRSGAVFGFLLETSSAFPVAIFRAYKKEGGLSLEMEVPDFDELMDLCNPERLIFSRIPGFDPMEEKLP